MRSWCAWVLPPKKQKQNAILQTLDEYVAKFDAMLKEGQSQFGKQEVFSEIQKIRMKLQELEEVNDKKTAKKVEQKLGIIETQIIELEQKYGK